MKQAIFALYASPAEKEGLVFIYEHILREKNERKLVCTEMWFSAFGLTGCGAEHLRYSDHKTVR